MTRTSTAASPDPFEHATEPYRSPRVAAEARLAELRDALARSQPEADTRARVFGRRVGRVAFGGVGIGGVTAMIGLAILGHLDALSGVLIGAWAAALLAYLAARLAVRILRPTSLPPARSPLTAIAAIEVELAAREAGRGEVTNLLAKSALILPAVFVFLLTPLTLHFFFELCTGALHGGYVSPSFGQWILTSMVFVGHAHVVGAVLAGRFASRLARMTTAELRAEKSFGFGALGWTVLASAIPGIVLYAVPPLIVAVTGLAFIPFLWRGLRRVALADREMLTATGAVDSIVPAQPPLKT